MMPPCSCATPGRNPGTSIEREQGHVEGIAGAHEPRGLVGGVDVQGAGQHRRLLGDDADASTAEPREPDDDVRCPCRLQLEELAIIDDAPNDVVHVVRLGGLIRDQRVERGVHPVDPDRWSRVTAGRQVVLRQVRQDPSREVERSRLVMSPPGARRR